MRELFTLASLRAISAVARENPFIQNRTGRGIPPPGPVSRLRRPLSGVVLLYIRLRADFTVDPDHQKPVLAGFPVLLALDLYGIVRFQLPVDLLQELRMLSQVHTNTP